MGFPHLSGSDHFHLLIDRKMKRVGLAGNISRIHFQLADTADLSAMEQQLRNNAMLMEVQNVRYQLRWPLLPKWTAAEHQTESVFLHYGLSEESFDKIVLNREVNNLKSLVAIDLCELENGSKHAVISMHHVLFDFQGMMNFVHGLNGTFSGNLFPETAKVSAWEIIRDSLQMTVYMLSRSVWKLGSLVRKNQPVDSPTYRSMHFTEAETSAIEKNAWNAGSRIGISSFLLAATGKSVSEILHSREEKPPYLWFSVPHNQRKLGSAGHLISNQLSFLFFKLNAEEIRSTKESVGSLNTQLKEQIRNQTVMKYSHLMDGMRMIPLWIYEQMVDVTSKGKLSSFGFSDLGTDQLTFTEFLGASVKTVFRYPPVPTPPGFNVTTIRSEGMLILTLAYGSDLLTEQEIDGMESSIRSTLLTVA